MREGRGHGGKNGSQDGCVSLALCVCCVGSFFFFYFLFFLPFSPFSLKLETQINLIKYSLASNACGQSPFPVSLLPSQAQPPVHTKGLRVSSQLFVSCANIFISPFGEGTRL